MSGSISFNVIPPGLRIPLTAIEFDNTQAVFASNAAQGVLMLGQTLVAQPMVPTPVTSVVQGQTLFGPASMLSRMITQFFANDSGDMLTVLPLVIAGGTAGVSTMTITGPATGAGTLALYVAGQVVQVAVNSGDTATVVATNVAAACAALGTLPATAAAAAGVVTFTAVHQGLSAGAIDTRLNYRGALGGEATPAGLTVAFATTTAGSGAPTLTAIDAILGDTQYDFFVTPFADTASLAALTAVMNNSTGRWAPMRKAFGHVWAAIPGSFSAQQALGAALDDPHLTVFGYEGAPTPPWEAVAMLVGTAAPALENDPARPLQTLQLQGFMPAPSASRYSKLQQQTLLTVGISTLMYDAAGNAYIQRAISTYTTNPLGQPDASYLDVTTLYTLMAISRQLLGAFQTNYPRAKLADDGTRFAAGQAIVTPAVALAEIAAQYSIMEYNGLVEDAAAMLQATIVQRNLTNPTRLDILWAPYLISPLIDIAVKNQFRLYSAAALAAATGA